MKKLMAAVALAAAFPMSAFASTQVVKTDDLLVKVGVRVQALELATINQAGPDEHDFQRTFMIRRARLQVDGKFHGCGYKFEFKVDKIFAKSTPSMQAENAFVECPVVGDEFGVRFGLFDMPFSRDVLVSDSAQLSFDRGLVSSPPSSAGLADNTYGITLFGRVAKHFAYQVGTYDNRNFDPAAQDIPTLAGRVEYDFFSTSDVYNDVHFGSGKWLSVGLNGALGLKTTQPGGAEVPLPAAYGFDAMIDLPLGPGRWFARGELDQVRLGQGPTEIDNSAMIETGYLFHKVFEPFFRLDTVHAHTAAGGKDATTGDLGVDWYLKGHNFKVQADVLKKFPDTGSVIDQMRVMVQFAI